jgi:hypothetical protein
MTIALFASEEDLRASESTFEEMSPPEGMGKRTSVDVYEVAAEVADNRRPQRRRPEHQRRRTSIGLPQRHEQRQQSASRGSALSALLRRAKRQSFGLDATAPQRGARPLRFLVVASAAAPLPDCLLHPRSRALCHRQRALGAAAGRGHEPELA